MIEFRVEEPGTGKEAWAVDERERIASFMRRKSRRRGGETIKERERTLRESLPLRELWGRVIGS